MWRICCRVCMHALRTPKNNAMMRRNRKQSLTGADGRTAVSIKHLGDPFFTPTHTEWLRMRCNPIRSIAGVLGGLDGGHTTLTQGTSPYHPFENRSSGERAGGWRGAGWGCLLIMSVGWLADADGATALSPNGRPATRTTQWAWTNLVPSMDDPVRTR
jgi:hypothetical protein